MDRKPTSFPQVVFVTSNTDIDRFKPRDFMLWGYHPHTPIKLEMAV